MKKELLNEKMGRFLQSLTTKQANEMVRPLGYWLSWFELHFVYIEKGEIAKDAGLIQVITSSSIIDN